MGQDWIYIIGNPDLKEGLMRIGLSSRPPEENTSDLVSESGFTPAYGLLFKARVTNGSKADREIHRRLKKYLYNADREYFRAPLDEAVAAVSDVVYAYSSKTGAPPPEEEPIPVRSGGRKTVLSSAEKTAVSSRTARIDRAEAGEPDPITVSSIRGQDIDRPPEPSVAPAPTRETRGPVGPKTSPAPADSWRDGPMLPPLIAPPPRPGTLIHGPTEYVDLGKPDVPPTIRARRPARNRIVNQTHILVLGLVVLGLGLVALGIWSAPGIYSLLGGRNEIPRPVAPTGEPPPPTEPAPTRKLEGRVTDVLAGDLIVVTQPDKRLEVRLFGIDCPEMDQDYGLVARQKTFSLAYWDVVTVAYQPTEEEGVISGEVFLSDGTSLNRKLVQGGFAWWDREALPDDRELDRLEARAKAEKRTLWAGEDPIPPWIWRSVR